MAPARHREEEFRMESESRGLVAVDVRPTGPMPGPAQAPKRILRAVRHEDDGQRESKHREGRVRPWGGIMRANEAKSHRLQGTC